MSHPTPPRSRPQARSLAELVGPTLDPVLRKRGLARSELFAWWPEIVGETYARSAAPERIRWPRGGGAAVLFVRCDPAVALHLTHERDRIRERLNGFLGYPAVAEVRIRQQPPSRPAAAKPAAAAPDPARLAALDKRLAGVDGPLREALAELGRLVLTRS
jgi:hypothetical protein